MNEQTEVVQDPVKEESAFAQKYHAEKLMKRAKKKAKKQLKHQGFSDSIAGRLVKNALGRIANAPERRAAGRGG
jgi:ribonucleotide reductase beta subunit family protein with ferritin-like domain